MSASPLPVRARGVAGSAVAGRRARRSLAVFILES